MKRTPLAASLFLMLVAPVTPAWSGQIDDELSAAIQAAAPGDYLGALVYLKERVDLPALEAKFKDDSTRLADRHRTVVTALRRVAADTQTDLLNDLLSRADQGGVRNVTPFWIVNAVGIDATPDQILEIASRDDVDTVFFKYGIELMDPVYMSDPEEGDDGLRAGPEKGLEAIRAPECWDIGIDGTGVLTSTLDTGVDGKHNALKDRWRGLDDRYSGHGEWAFFDPVTNKTFPFDAGSHGTHTMGTVLGGEPGDQVGVAPGAQWIHAAVIDRVSIQQTVDDAILAFQWLIDPDGDATTFWDVPTACSNSWRLVTGHGYPPCDDTFWEYLDACEAAGIVILFSAGNEGPTKESVGRPPDRATDDYRCFSVGAVNANNDSWPIASFSSRGPSHCTDDGSETIKPEVVAPGENVRSSVPGNSYANFSGTSMASPHVNGVVTLMRQANPEIPVEEVKQILFDTSIDLGKDGEDNDYGHGMIDAFTAVQRAAETAGVLYKFPDGRPRIIDPAGGDTIRLEILPGPKDEPVPGTAKFMVDTGNGLVEGKITQLQDNVYDAKFPPCACGTVVKYHFSVEGKSGKSYVNPGGAPRNLYQAEPFNSTGPIFTENFEQAGQWYGKKGQGVDGGLWERGVPINDGSWAYDPESDGDGSGACWLTANQPGPSDVDGGIVLLYSPAFDLRKAVSIRYMYYYNEYLDRDGDDSLFLEISPSGERNTWKEVTRHKDNNGLKWTQVEVTREQMEAAGLKIGATMYLRFSAADLGDFSVVEAGIDGFEIIGATCVDVPPGKPGDMNCDGGVDFDDVDPFVTAITSESQYESQYPDCRYLNGDVNGDGSVTFDDIDPFVACLVDGGC